MPTKRSTPAGRLLVPVEVIARRIYLIRGRKVMLDFDLAELYEVPTRVLNQAVRRNLSRFPEDFMFRLTKEEAQSLRSQSVTGSQKHRDPRAHPYAFTEQGVAMLSSVLKSERAVEVNIAIMRTFAQLRRRARTGVRRKLPRRVHGTPKAARRPGEAAQADRLHVRGGGVKG